MFGANLRILAQKFPSISELSRQLGVNRTQFNRYLAGESFPRPDVLARMCDFFDVDARILLEPVSAIQTSADPMTGEVLGNFLGKGAGLVSEQTFPKGFYRFSRRSFINQNEFVVGVVRVFDRDGSTYVRGFEAKAAMRAQGLPVDRASREFRGLVMQQEEGVAALISRMNAMTCSFNYLMRETSFENNYWIGYVARTVRESMSGDRVVRKVYEHLGTDWRKARVAASKAGYCSFEDLLPFHQRLLRPDDPFR